MPSSTESTHLIVADMSGALNADQREFYEERAGILQYDAHLNRLLAEALALLEVINRDGWPPRHSRESTHLI